MTAPENPPRWAPDPLGRHQYRYWDGTQWTEHVSDNGSARRSIPLHRDRAPTRTDDRVERPVTRHRAGPRRPGGAPRRLGAAPGPAPGGAGAARRSHDPTASSVAGTARSSSTPPSACSRSRVFFFPFATERTPEETLRLPGCHLAADDTSTGRVRRPHRRDSWTTPCTRPNVGAFIGLSVLLHVPLLRGRRGLFGASLGQADHGPPRRHRDRQPHRRPQVDGAVGAVRGRRTAVVLPLRHHHVVGVAGPSPPRRHGRRHLRRRPRRRRPPVDDALTRVPDDQP